MSWVKLHDDVNTDGRFLSVSLQAQAIYLRLLPLLRDGAGSLPLVPGHSAAETIRVIFKGVDSYEMASSILAEWLRVGLVSVTSDSIEVRAFASRQGSTVIQGEGSRRGKSSTERSRERRAKLRNVGATEMQRVACNGSATADATEVQRDESLHATADATDATDCDDSYLSDSIEENDSATKMQRTASALDKRREEKNREDTLSLTLSRNETVASSRQTKATKSRKPKAEPVEDPVPTEGDAAKVYRAIVGDRILGPITNGPGDFALRVTAEGAYPRVDVLSEVRKAGEYAARGKTTYRDGRAFLSRWLSRAAEDAAKRPAPITRLPTAEERDEGIERLIAEGLM